MLAAAKPKSKYIFAILRIAVVTAGLTWGILWLRQADRFAALVQVLRKMNLWIFAAVLGVFVLSQLIIALRWWLLLRAQSVFIKYWTAVRLFLLGWFYNNFMPGSVGGDFVRAWYVTRHTDKKFQAALSVFVDRALGLFTTLLIAVFCYTVFLSGQRAIIAYRPKDGFLAVFFTHKWLFAAVVAAAAAVLAVIVLYRPVNPVLAKLFSSIRAGFYHICEVQKCRHNVLYQSRNHHRRGGDDSFFAGYGHYCFLVPRCKYGNRRRRKVLLCVLYSNVGIGAGSRQHRRRGCGGSGACVAFY